MSVLFRERFVVPLRLVVAVILLAALLPGVAAAQANPTLVNTILTSNWNPPSPDPSGITYWPTKNRLVVADGEVEEMDIYEGKNVWVSELDGDVTDTFDTTGFNNEPVGIDIDVAPNGHFFISNDSAKTIFEINLGADERLGTNDDDIRSFSTSSFGNTDPEGLTLGAGKLFTVDGAGAEVYVTDPGSGGVFGDGNDTTTHFDVFGKGIEDPEGIEYDPSSNTLYVVDRKKDKVTELTVGGAVVRVIDLRAIITGVLNPGDLTLAPSSQNASVNSLYIVERGVDNNDDPNENDGKIYEISLGGGTVDPAPSVTNRVPAPNATGVSVSANVTATFSEEVTGVSETSFTLEGPGSTPVNADVSYNSSNDTATLNPDADLAPNTLYTARLTNAIKDSANQALSPISWSFTTAAEPPPGGDNLLQNPGFEIASGGQPTVWSTNNIFTQSGDVAHEGASSGKFTATNEAGATIQQRVTGLIGGTTYNFSEWMNVPTTGDTFVYKVKVKWRNASNKAISTSVILTVKKHTSGAWVQHTASAVAPTGTASADVMLVVTKLSSTIYVDETSFGT